MKKRVLLLFLTALLTLSLSGFAYAANNQAQGKGDISYSVGSSIGNSSSMGMYSSPKPSMASDGILIQAPAQRLPYSEIMPSQNCTQCRPAPSLMNPYKTPSRYLSDSFSSYSKTMVLYPLLWIGLIGFALVAYRSLRYPNSAIKLLQKRFASGEINEEEYLKRLEILKK